MIKWAILWLPIWSYINNNNNNNTKFVKRRVAMASEALAILQATYMKTNIYK